VTPNHSTQVAAYFEANKHKYNFEHVDGCGKYTEDCVRECLRPLDTNWGLLKYEGSGTKYNGHRIDSILYRLPNIGDTLLHSIDIIVAAESDHASSGWGPDTPRYTEADWLAEPKGPISSNTVPYQPYQGDASNNELKRTLSFDYSRRPQGVDWDVSVWAFRFQHSALMGPIPPELGGKPLGTQGAMNKHRPEWCAALGVPVIPVPNDWVTP
jgi:hypothetical protein